MLHKQLNRYSALRTKTYMLGMEISTKLIVTYDYDHDHYFPDHA